MIHTSDFVYTGAFVLACALIGLVWETVKIVREKPVHLEAVHIQ